MFFSHGLKNSSFSNAIRSELIRRTHSAQMGKWDPVGTKLAIGWIGHHPLEFAVRSAQRERMLWPSDFFVVRHFETLRYPLINRFVFWVIWGVIVVTHLLLVGLAIGGKIPHQKKLPEGWLRSTSGSAPRL